MGYGGRDGGSEWMGVPPSRYKKKKRVSGNAVKGGFKLPKSKGANSAETRFGIEKDDKYLLHRRPAYITKPAKRRPMIGMRDMGGRGVLRKGR